jgi:hypothetical protein
MAHFAQLDSNNIVLQVIVVDNKNTATHDGIEEEWIGQAFCVRLFGGTQDNWKQTSYNGNFRKNYAGIGYTYDPVLDAFIPPQPYPNCVLDPDTCKWNCPPQDGNDYLWNAEAKRWDPVVQP